MSVKQNRRIASVLLLSNNLIELRREKEIGPTEDVE
jgi:hypothetical protein